MVEKSLDIKLRKIHADPFGSKEFILADAKDADMALSIGATGRSLQPKSADLPFRTLEEFREQIVQIVEQGLVDIMLMSASTNEILTIDQGIFQNSHVTPAARANDTTDVHVIRGAVYPSQPSMPFRTATLDHIQCGQADCPPESRIRGANLGLYSITFNNDTRLDREALENYKLFRLEAERKGFRHFLEIFDPNVPGAVDPALLPAFINDAIVRLLGGVTSTGRPLFLKMVYHGPKALEELVHYDPHLVVGILGGSAGTTYDAFKLLSEAKKYGGRVALFGRKINNAENQLAFVRFLRWIADGEISPEEAVKAYHGVLQQLGIKPTRELADDMQLQTGVMSYGGTKTVSIGEPKPQAPAKSAEKKDAKHDDCGCGCKGTCDSKKPEPKATKEPSGQPNFRKMTSAQKVAYHLDRWNKILG